jgi:aminobenzoyl-glutamate utilization protein B
MATPIAHKGSIAGAKVQARHRFRFPTRAGPGQAGVNLFQVQIKETKYVPLMSPSDQPAIELNREKMEKFRPELRK